MTGMFPVLRGCISFERTHTHTEGQETFPPFPPFPSAQHASKIYIRMFAIMDARTVAKKQWTNVWLSETCKCLMLIFLTNESYGRLWFN